MIKYLMALTGVVLLGAQRHPHLREFQNELLQDIDIMNVFLLFLGILLYWLKEMDKAKETDPFFSLWRFIGQKSIRIIIALVSGIAVITLAPYIDPKIIDLQGRLSNFLIGMGGVSIINGLSDKVQNRKKTIPNPHDDTESY